MTNPEPEPQEVVDARAAVVATRAASREASQAAHEAQLKADCAVTHLAALLARLGLPRTGLPRKLDKPRVIDRWLSTDEHALNLCSLGMEVLCRGHDSAIQGLPGKEVAVVNLCIPLEMWRKALAAMDTGYGWSSMQSWYEGHSG